VLCAGFEYKIRLDQSRSACATHGCGPVVVIEGGIA
jgi:hypothetical protein